MSVTRRKLLGLAAAGAASLAGLVAVDRRHSSGPASLTAGPVGDGDAPVQPAPPSPAPSASGSAAPSSDTSDTLVVFFSKTGRNYPDLNLKVGNTAQIARFIHDRIGGDIFEIKPAEPYPADYDATVSLAETEEQRTIYRPIQPGAPDTSHYRTVFLGYPIWWSEQPMAVQTFMRDHDLNHARIVPFVTHAGSGFGNSLSVLSQYYPQARVLDGFSAVGTQVHGEPAGARRDVGTWLARLGF